MVFEKILSETFKGLPRDITEETGRPRSRGTLLMAISNKTPARWVVTTRQQVGNVGRLLQALWRNDGGFNPIKDILQDRSVSSVRPAQFPGSPDGALGPSGEVIR